MTGSFWLVIVLCTLGTLAMRLVPMLAHGRVRTPAALERLLAHVPAAALAALAIPGSLWLKSEGVYHVSPERIAAMAVAGVVAWRTRSIVWTIAAGMVALWGIQYAL